MDREEVIEAILNLVPQIEPKKYDELIAVIMDFLPEVEPELDEIEAGKNLSEFLRARTTS